MADLPYTSFFTLLAELQIKVYDCILDNVSDKPTPQSLEPYSAIILSCKETKNNFEHEWTKVFNNFVSKFVEGSELGFMPVKTLRDAQHMRYMVPYNMTALHTPAMKNVIVGLPSISRLLTLRLDKDFPVYQGNMRDFRHTEQYRALLALWANIYHGISPMPEEYKPCHPVRMRIEL